MIFAKKMLLIILAVFCLTTFSIPCLAEADIYEANRCTVRNPGGSCDVYAWTPEYLFIAQGYWIGDEFYKSSWAAPHYRIIRMDRNSGSEEILVEEIPATLLDMFVYNDQIYLFWQRLQGSDPSLGNPCHLQIIDFDGNPVEGEYQVMLEDYAQDHVFGDGCMYLLTEEEIFVWNYLNGELISVYDAGFIENDQYDARAIFTNGQLIFQDENRIVAMNPENYETKTLTTLDYTHDHEYYSAIWGNVMHYYHYAVIGNALYYYDLPSKQTVKMDLADGTVQPVSEDEYYFIQVGKEGIAVVRWDAVQWNTFNEYCTLELEMLYFPYADIENPAFDPENTEAETLLRGFSALMDNGEWVVEKESEYTPGWVNDFRDVSEIDDSYMIWNHPGNQ